MPSDPYPGGEPSLHVRREHDANLPLRAWSFPEPVLAVSSGPLGGGIGLRSWIINATVDWGYGRMDPDRHAADLARSIGLTGTGVGLLTAVDVRHRRLVLHAGAALDATVGVSDPVWAAAPEAAPSTPADGAGTINFVVVLPERLSEAALVNAVATIAEAKAQAFADAGVAGTGTPTDSVTIVCPAAGPAAPFGGPRSPWGARVARMAHRAVVDGIAAQDRWVAAYPDHAKAPVPTMAEPVDLDAGAPR